MSDVAPSVDVGGTDLPTEAALSGGSVLREHRAFHHDCARCSSSNSTSWPAPSGAPVIARINPDPYFPAVRFAELDIDELSFSVFG
jgi:hypothetical protein